MRLMRKTKSDMQLTIDPEAAIIRPQPAFHSTISFVIVFGQFFGIMPLHYMTNKNWQDVKFKWNSLRTLLAFYNIIGAFVMNVFGILKFALHGLMLDKTVTISFYTLNFLGALQFIQIARNWSTILKETALVEMATRSYGSIFNMKKRFIIITSIIMPLALVEHLLFIMNALFTARENCENFDSFQTEIYFGLAFPFVFTVIPYDPLKATLVEIANVISTFTWNFTDLFIILVSCSLAGRFAQINKKLEHNKVMHEKFWKEIREDYNKVSRLSHLVDQHLSPLVMISFISNVFFICVQLYNSLKERFGVVDSIYYFYSFGFVLGRTVAVTLYGAWIHDESRKPLQFLHSVPSEYYCEEISRFIQQINSSPVAITGSKFFMVTRCFLLKMASTIVTFELMFLQFGSFENGPKPPSNECIK